MEVVNRGVSPRITPRRPRVGRNFIQQSRAAVARFVITSDRKGKRTVSLHNFRISSYTVLLSRQRGLT